MVLAVGLTALVMMFLWRDQSAYKPVFGAREKVVAADMMSVLDAEHIPYRLHPDTGQVLVPDAMLGKVRMLLASKGVTAKLPAGLELMDRNEPLGVSQFVQDVHFRRGLEGDLVQSILALDAVDSARVHLSIAKSSSFVLNDGEKSSASVVLALKPGRTLGAEQIAAIVNLVAGSVSNLDPQRVSLIDQAGNFLSARIDLSDGFEGAQGGNEGARRFQDETRRNIRDLLANVVGEQNYRVSVTADIDNDRIQETREVYGSTPKVTTEAVREEKDREALAIGVPGSLSSRPVNVSPPAAQGAPASPEASTAQKSATSRQYFYDRNITQIKRGRGRLRRLNVAVVLDAAAAPGRNGAWKKEEIEGIERMLRSGLGIDAERGDQLTVSTLPFTPKPAVEPWWQQRDNLVEFGTWAAYAVGALLAYLLIWRPVLRIAQQRLASSQALPVAPSMEMQDESVPTAVLSMENGVAAALPNAASSVPLLENYELPPAGSPVDVMIDHLKVLSAKEPERVAEVVKQWVQKNVRPE